MIWKSVVGKLWMTIIGLVAIVLLSLSLFLTQYFDRFYFQQESNELLLIARAVTNVLNSATDPSSALDSVSQLIEGEDRKLHVIIRPEDAKTSPLYEILQDPRIEASFHGEEVTFRGIFPIIRNNQHRDEEFLIVALPLKIDNHNGIILIYESLNAVNQTTAGTKNLILYAAGFGIILTTFFAFFLSTRITQPLIQMKEAARKIAKGDFASKVEIRSHDEIGELASTFNHMAAQLNESVHMLSREKEQLASILRSMADGVISVDQNMNIVISNPMAERYLFDWQYETSSLPEPLIMMFADCIEKEEEVIRDIEIQGRILSIAINPLYDRNLIRGAVAVFRDITNERKLDKLRKDFVANVSHELRTPIAMLQGYSEAILDGIAATEEERTELIKIIYDESVRMSNLVNELLDLARMEAGHIHLQPEKIEMNTFMKKVIRKFHGIAKERNIHLTYSIVPDEFTAYLDEGRMEQVFTNLIDNAIRHTPANGEIKVSAEKLKNAIQFKVSDSGSGIPDEDLPFVFERFYKGDKARTRGRAGTGLGLSIVKNIVEAHHGHIHVYSELGKGSTFVIKIPQKLN